MYHLAPDRSQTSPRILNYELAPHRVADSSSRRETSLYDPLGRYKEINSEKSPLGEVKSETLNPRSRPRTHQIFVASIEFDPC